LGARNSKTAGLMAEVQTVLESAHHVEGSNMFWDFLKDFCFFDFKGFFLIAL
jgi:hypothetical protein